MFKKDNLPYLFFAVAVTLAVWFAKTESKGLKGNLAGGFVIFLGLAVIFWGFQALGQGRVLVRHRHVTRDEHPVIFWSVIVLFRFLLGAALVLGGVWHLFFTTPR